MNKSIIKGLEMIKDGIELILKSEEVEADTAVTKSAPEKTVKVSESVSAKSADNASSEYTKEELDGMSYNDLKKLAKELGISAVGNRKEITEKILNHADFNEDEEPDEEVEEKPVKKTDKSAVKSVKKSAPVDEEDEDEEEPDEEDEEDEEEDEVDPVEQQVLEAVEDMEDDEIREILDDVGVSSKGKRQSLIAKLVQAVKDGKIDFDDSDDSEDEDDTDEEADEDTADEDVTESMTKKRKKAYLAFCEETKESFDDGEITREDLIEFINDFNGTKDKMKKVSDEDLVNTYLEISANLIDDDGNIVEEGAYTINDVPYCCGKPLKYDEDEEMFICEVCGEEYSGEDE